MVRSAAQERVIAHVRTHFGEPAWTIPFTKHEPALHLFVFERPRGIPGTLVMTCGMSELPMKVPDHVEDKSLQYAELCMLLPPSWPTEPSRIDDLTEWPFETLVQCARLPHRNKTWLWRGHTVYDGTPWPGTQLCSVMLTPPYSFDQASWVIDGEPPIHIFQLVPITAGELAIKNEQGSSALVDELMDYDPHVFGALEPQRRCSVTDKTLFDASSPIALPASSAPDPRSAAALIDRFGVWRRALDRYEEAAEQHELMQDDDTAEELDEATAAATRAHDEMVALLRRLDASGTDVLFTALERVLDGAGVSVAYLESFRTWPGQVAVGDGSSIVRGR